MIGRENIMNMYINIYIFILKKGFFKYKANFKKPKDINIISNKYKCKQANMNVGLTVGVLG